MYRIIATEDFISLLKDLPIKYIALLTNSFVSIEEIKEEKEETLAFEENAFIIDLLTQIRNQELE